MTYVMVDVESDGPIPGDYSMISFGAIIVERPLTKTFFRKIKPISEKFILESLSVSGYTREETLSFEDPVKVMGDFDQWLKDLCITDPTFISDNNGYDWMFICWYFHHFIGENPFGYSSQNLGSLYKGLVKDTGKNFKHLRRTIHSHNPLDDAKGNAEALLSMENDMMLKLI